jgi:hypothetical protein
MDINALGQSAVATLMAVGWKVAAAIVLWLAGRCASQHYWQVYFDTNNVIRDSFGAAGFPAPAPAYLVTGFMPVAPVEQQH